MGREPLVSSCKTRFISSPGASWNSTSKWSRQRDVLVGQRVHSDAEFGDVDFKDIIQVVAASAVSIVFTTSRADLYSACL